MRTFLVHIKLYKRGPDAQENDRGPSMDCVRSILLQKPVVKAEEHHREAHKERDRHHIGFARVSTDDQPIHLLLVRDGRAW
jgi:hypothetical protein